jgi:diguanylate cyclase (GGDEF)-like protein
VSLLTYFVTIFLFYYIQQKNIKQIAIKEYERCVKNINTLESEFFKNRNLSTNHIKQVEKALGLKFTPSELKQQELMSEDGVYRFSLEKRYDKSCLSCHISKKEDDLAGSFLVTIDFKDVISSSKKLTLLFFILLSPIPIFGAIFIASIVSKRIENIKTQILKEIDNINNVKDLTRVEEIKKNTIFKELDDIFDGLNRFLKKTRETAVDRDILELEIKILKKFLITSEVIRDWRKYVLSLIVDMNKIIEVQLAFSLFRVNENDFCLEFFWTKPPSEELKEYVEKLIEIRCKNFYSQYCHFKAISIHHSVAPSDRCEIFHPSILHFETKSLILDEPKIGGIVGVGINTKDVEDKAKSLVIEGILTTLLNVIGSVKAIAKYNKELEYYSTRDNITNLFNQRIFWELLNYEVARGRRHNYKFAVAIIDLDNFKFLNDNFGHDIGDSFLSGVAEVIKKNVRLGDIVARYSGDEFTIIMPETDSNEAYNISKRILEKIEKFTLNHKDKQINITASAGYAIFPDHGDDAKELFAFADTMLFKSKTEGKNKVLKPSDEDIYRVNKLISEKSFQITRAIDENRIIPFFQPIIDLKTGSIGYYEVLCRIDMGDKIISAYEFIEIAEKTGNIIKIDYIMMENAFNILKNHPGKTLFINLSPKSLIITEFIPKVIDTTKRYGINPENIVFELTERDTVRNLSILEKFVANLRSEGYKFAIDDFGSGFSSYDYIKRFPVDYVKIDGEFIKNILTSSKDLAIVKSLLILTEEFGIKTIAEFVENQEVLGKLKELKVDYAQGYLIGKPDKKL